MIVVNGRELREVPSCDVPHRWNVFQTTDGRWEIRVHTTWQSRENGWVVVDLHKQPPASVAIWKGSLEDAVNVIVQMERSELTCVCGHSRVRHTMGGESPCGHPGCSCEGWRLE